MKPCARLLFSFMTLLLSGGLLYLSVTEAPGITFAAAVAAAVSLLFFLLSLRCARASAEKLCRCIVGRFAIFFSLFLCPRAFPIERDRLDFQEMPKEPSIL